MERGDSRKTEIHRLKEREMREGDKQRVWGRRQSVVR